MTKPFSLIVRNASSVLDFYSLFFILYSLFFILPLVLLFISFVFNFLVGVFMGLCLNGFCVLDF
ncbi:hypothetical protein ACM24_00330 [Helicobacter pylori]|nr:hypothetical protein ACM24_00330 [Helicobacter pylori]